MRIGAVVAMTAVAFGCGEEHRATGVQLTIEYGDPAPAWLYVAGQTEDGRFHGPNLLPDPPRPLAPARETVLLDLPEGMHGEVLSLSVTGLNARRVARMRGAVRAEVIAHTIQSAFVSLTVIAACAGEQIDNRECAPEDPFDAGGVPIPGTIDDAGMLGSRDATTGGDGSVLDGSVLDGSIAPDPVTPEPQPSEPAPPGPDVPPPPMMIDAGAACSGTDCVTAMRCGAEGACDVRCPAGAHCTIDCGEAKNCHPVCSGATCAIDCRDAERCMPTCEGGADCEITCQGESCKPRCRGASQCLVRCHGEDCELQCERDDERRTCDDEALVCNRECPDDD
jgi:hypothetical protein